MADWYFLGTIYTVSNNVAKNGLLDWGWLSVCLCAVSFSHSSSSVGAIVCCALLLHPHPPSVTIIMIITQKPQGPVRSLLGSCLPVTDFFSFEASVFPLVAVSSSRKKNLTAYYVELHKGHFSLASLEIWPVGWEWTVTQLHSLVFGGAS